MVHNFAVRSAGEHRKEGEEEKAKKRRRRKNEREKERDSQIGRISEFEFPRNMYILNPDFEDKLQTR